jgi:hypothetical protein
MASQAGLPDRLPIGVGEPVIGVHRRFCNVCESPLRGPK